MKAPTLEHSDLIAIPGVHRAAPASGLRRRHAEILLPDETPIHPDALSCEDVFTREFLLHVMRELPRSVAEDLDAIQETLGFRPDVEVDGAGISRVGFPQSVRFGDVGHFLDADARTVVIGQGRTKVGIIRKPDVLYMMELAYDHPTPVEKARAYAVPAADLDVELMPGEIPLYVWSVTTNLLHQGWPWMMLVRSFAILFSNMALARMTGRSAATAAP